MTDDDKTRLTIDKDDDATRIASSPSAAAVEQTQSTQPNSDISEPGIWPKSHTQPSNLGSDQTVRAGDATAVAEISWQTQIAKPPTAYNPPENTKLLRPGNTVRDRFVLESVLGTGGMGTVFLALDKRKQEARDAEPHVAMKVLSGEIAKHPQAFILLQRETRKSQQLAHPNIITVYDFDRDTESGSVYMIMEALRGQTLDRIITEHPEGLPLDQVNHIVDGISQGLAYAHSKDIVHSDLKPGNVFVTEDNVVKLLDFGIARAISDSSSPGDQTVFDAGELGGLTPTYASLEMFQGNNPSPSDDVYALGLITYELIAGTHPYRRLPAPKALQEQRSVERPKTLNARQWRAVNGAVALTPDDRILTVDAFRKLYFGRPLRLLLSSVALGLITLTAALTLTLAPPAEPEAAPFETLPADIQRRVETNLAQAREALQFGDINAALHHISVVDEAHPYNPTGKILANDLVEMTLARIEPLADDVEADRIQTLLSYPPLARNRVLLKRLDELQ